MTQFDTSAAMERMPNHDFCTALRGVEMQEKLELIVDEPIVGHFFWTVIRPGRSGEQPRVIDYARGPLPSRNVAADAGAAAMHLHLAANEKPAWSMTGLRESWGLGSKAETRH
jgi:hypothetical protein